MTLPTQHTDIDQALRLCTADVKGSAAVGRPTAGGLRMPAIWRIITMRFHL